MKTLRALSLAISTSLLLATPTRRSKEQVLHDLDSAVETSDGQAVQRLTAELRALVPTKAAVRGGQLLATSAKQEGQRSSGFLLRRHTAIEAEPQKFKTITVTLRPGKLGIFADWKQGRISDVEYGGQAQKQGMKAGMFMKEIDGQPYTEALLDSKSAGAAEYKVTLAVPVTADDKKKPADDKKKPQAAAEAPVQAPVAQHVEKAKAIFEDTIFHMTPEADAEVRKQLLSKEGAEALSWIKTGGWYHCGYEGETCKCVGDVRYGTPHTKKWSTPKTVSSGAILCSKDIFGDPAPGEGKQCNCHRANFELTKNENSVSYLQESWIFMLRLLARMKLLPFTGDRRYHGLELWSHRHGGVTGGTLERYWIEKYVVENYRNIPGGTCLEWGFYYVNWMNQCTHKYENKYEAVKYGQKQPSVEGNVVYASIYDFPSVIGRAHLQFNFICATELFEHLEKPYEAAAALYKIMAPGGAILFTVPQQAQYHKVPQDFLRYTKEGVKHVMETAGFCVPPQLMAGSGDFIFDVARNVGLQIQDFTIEELDEGYQRGYDSISDGAITIHAMAYKPPHAYCR